MADFDTSSYQNKVLPLNPLDNFNKAATLRGTLNQNQLFQQQFKTNKAVSDIFKDAVLPDGTLDMNKVRRKIAEDPDAAYGLQEVYKGAQGLQQGQIATNSAQVDLIQKKAKALAGYLVPMVNGGTSHDVAMALAHAETNGIITQEERNKIVSSIPWNPATGKFDDSKIPTWAQEQLVHVLETQKQLDYYNPTPTQIDTPQGTRFARIPQALGAVPTDAGGFIPKVPDPTTKVWDDKTQQYRYVGVQPNGGMGGPPQPQGPAGGGMGGQPPAQATPNAFPPGTAAAPPLGAPEAAAGDAGVSIKMGEELTRRADQTPNNKALLGNLSTALDQFTSGPGADWKRVGKAMVNANSPFGNIFDPKTIQSQEEFVKQAVQLAQSQYQQIGGTGTDAKLDSAMHTSPNEALSKMGNKGIIALLKGNEDAIQAKGRAWSDYAAAGGLKNYRQFSTEFNKNYDPRVFQAQYLSDADKKKMLSSMSQKEINALVHSANFARQNGWIQ